jgi:hypothetical protein
MMASEIARKNVSGGRVWTRTRCGRGHLAEHPNGVDESDFCDCWCGVPRVAATVFRIASATTGASQSRGLMLTKTACYVTYQ